MTRAIIARKCPEYLPAYDLYMSKTHGHHFNMFVMKKELLQHYCTWLFDILFELERELDMTGYTVNDRRVFGFGERASAGRLAHHETTSALRN